VRTVSVVIPVYNRAHAVCKAVESALQQTHPPHEVIVVDDGSTDESSETLARFGERIRILHQENRGVAAARNAGIAAATGTHILFLDSDDVLDPSCIARELARFAEDPSLGLVFTGTEFFDPEGLLVRPSTECVDGQVAEELLLLERNIISTVSGVMVPRSVLERTGSFDERLRVSEDWDFFYRIALLYPVGRVPEVLVRCSSHPDGLHADIPAMEHGMMLAFEKAFAIADANRSSLRGRAYSRLHFILAGCYLHARRPGRTALHLLRSARHDLGLFTRMLVAKVKG
jgi:glycosyltransferase involved in cell wall biosynthesis